MNDLVPVAGRSESFSKLEIVSETFIEVRGVDGEDVIHRKKRTFFPLKIDQFLIKSTSKDTLDAQKQRTEINLLNMNINTFYNNLLEVFAREAKSYNALNQEMNFIIRYFFKMLPKRFYKVKVIEPKYYLNSRNYENAKIEIIELSPAGITYAEEHPEIFINRKLTTALKKQLEKGTEEDFDEFIDDWAKKLLNRKKEE